MAEHVIYKNILENMSDGVMTIDQNGVIVTFNEAAEEILGLKTDEALGKRFGEVFLVHEGSDELNETILHAVYESQKIHNRVIGYSRGAEKLFLNVTTSYLEHTDKKERSVIVVLDDITEKRKMEAEQERLSVELKAKHRELQGAYLSMEESNKNLEMAVKKTKSTRLFALGFIVVFFIAMGLFYWGSKPSSRAAKFTGPGPGPQASGQGTQQTYTVTPRTISSSITLTGDLRPLNTVHVVSPFAGNVKEMYFQYGQTVKKGDPLLKLDTNEVEVKGRDAETAYIKAVEKVKEMETWDAGGEVSEAKRSLIKAQMELDAQKQAAGEAERLYKKGIIPATEYENSKRQYANARMSYESAQHSLDKTLAKGSGDNLKIARFELENARLKLFELRRQISQALVKSPTTGTILLAESGGDKEKKSKQLGQGTSVSQGETLVSIGDLDVLCVKAMVDEMSVMSIKKGQKVRITGEAFPGTTLDGEVFHVSSQAAKSEAGRGEAASFEVTTVINKLKPEQRTSILLGMSTNLSIIFYEKADAIMVPIPAVRSGKDGPFVEVRQGTEKKQVKIQPGLTTLDAVEVKAGLKAGDVVVF